MLTLLKNIKIYSPEYLGVKDILFSDRVLEIRDSIEISYRSLKTIDCSNKLLLPGFVDSHVHLIGGGGEGGYSTRTPEANFSDLVNAGITTVVGCLGTDGVTRSLKSLVAKTKGLREKGMNAYLLTGSYRIPVETITGSIMEDIMMIDEIIGTGEIALSDHRSSNPTFQEFLRTVSDSRIGGMLSGKGGKVIVHMGSGKDGIDFITRLIDESEIPITQVIPTHMGRNKTLLRQGIELCLKGGCIDFTTSTVPEFLEKGEVEASKALKVALDSGISPQQISFSSDGQGSLPVFDHLGNLTGIKVGKSTSLFYQMKKAILEEGVSIEDAVKVITSSPADMLNLKGDGHIEIGNLSNLVLLDHKSLDIEKVFLRGCEIVSS